jgi:hypothetical protein
MEDHHSQHPSDKESINFYAHMIKQIEFIKFNSVNKDIVKSTSFVIDESIINDLEIEKNICFEFTALKKYMDKWIAEGVENNEGNWELRKNIELVKIWNRWEGSEFNNQNPVIRSETYFSKVPDP